MSFKGKQAVVRAILYLGAAFDALWALALVWPSLYGLLTGRIFTADPLDLRLAMGIGASLMAGWTVLLLWAAQNAVQRRGVLLITALPVVPGLFSVALTGALKGGAGFWIPVKCVVLEILMLYAWRLTKSLEKKGEADENRD